MLSTVDKHGDSNYKFSIIIPVYNAEKYISSSVESVLEQNYKNWELILVNDGSIDSSLNICKKYANNDARIIIVDQTNQGTLLARVNGSKRAFGDYLLFLDSDDFFSTNALEKLNETAIKHANDVMLFNYNKVDEKGEVIEFNNRLIKNKKKIVEIEISELKKIFLRDSRLNNMWSKAIKREIFLLDRTEYNKLGHLTMAEDKLQTAGLIFNSKKAIYINISLYNYRNNPSGAVNNFNLKAFYDSCKVHSFLNINLGNYNLKSTEFVAFKNNLLKYEIGAFYRYLSLNKLEKKEKFIFINKFRVQIKDLKFQNASFQNKLMIIIIERSYFFIKIISFINKKRISLNY